ncbi:AMP-binding protein [Paenibacillus sp. N3/727]|uniref:AMP-binding protein n=1 Tax=Paenibacillus sp. N3/727 TaxID=2925845 RepID=UPI001F5358D2|nr:AMP-binding protein [Paenibacillus sp. N3/727]UNK18918.1 AMP-binding protein [Paenibacillus sp. N3/727]
MLFVNKAFFTSWDFKRVQRHISQMLSSSQITGHIIAAALRDPIEIIALVKEVIHADGSILLMNGDTPKGQAVQSAQEAGCRALFHGSLQEGPYLLNGRSQMDIPSLLQFSSGTTGKPKVIRRSWNHVEREIAHYNEALQSDSAEQPIVLVPVSHSFGLITGVLSALERGAVPIVITDKNPKFAAHLIQTTPTSIVYAVPYLFHILQSITKNSISFHKVVSSGAPLTGALFEKMKNCTQHVYQQYGCSELGCIAIGSDPASHADVGTPLKHLMVEAEGSEKEPGEIVVTMDECTVHTHDAGWKNAEGRLQLAGRMDDLINVTGLKVIPYEVEQVLFGVDGVEEAVVYKTRHKVWGEAVKAMVVASSHSITPEMLKQRCMERLPNYKVPSTIVVVQEIPKTAAGKISRKLLSEQY